MEEVTARISVPALATRMAESAIVAVMLAVVFGFTTRMRILFTTAGGGD